MSQISLIDIAGNVRSGGTSSDRVSTPEKQYLLFEGSPVTWQSPINLWVNHPPICPLCPFSWKYQF